MCPLNIAYSSLNIIFLVLNVYILSVISECIVCVTTTTFSIFLSYLVYHKGSALIKIVTLVENVLI